MSASAMDMSVATAFAAIPNPLHEQWKASRQALIERGPSEGHILVAVDKEEWWPVYELLPLTTADAYTDVIEVTPELVGRTKAAHKEWRAVQDEISELIDKARGLA